MSGRQQSSTRASTKASKRGSARPYPLKKLQVYLWSFIVLATFSSLAGFEAGRFRGVSQWGSQALVHAASLHEVPAASATPDPDATLSSLSPQEQAQELLERAVHRDFQALDLINKNVDAWRGHLQDNDTLSELVHGALTSDDLRVRAAAVEVDLATNNLTKSPQSVTRLVKNLRDNPADRPWTLWRLGALGNRGVQPDIVLAQLLNYTHDRNEETRYWAVEGLAILGTDATIDPLLDRFAHDSSSRVRKRAACNLAASGMLTKQQRLTAVPELLNFFDDDALDSTTRSWVYGALRLITGAEIGNDPDAWRKWWAKRDTSNRNAHRPTKYLYA
jgi:HEAT repeats